MNKHNKINLLPNQNNKKQQQKVYHETFEMHLPEEDTYNEEIKESSQQRIVKKKSFWAKILRK